MYSADFHLSKFHLTRRCFGDYTVCTMSWNIWMSNFMYWIFHHYFRSFPLWSLGLEQEWHNIISFFFSPLICKIYPGMLRWNGEGRYSVKKYSRKDPIMYDVINSDNIINIMMPLNKENQGKIKFLR